MKLFSFIKSVASDKYSGEAPGIGDEVLEVRESGFYLCALVTHLHNSTLNIRLTIMTSLDTQMLTESMIPQIC